MQIWFAWIVRMASVFLAMKAGLVGGKKFLSEKPKISNKEEIDKIRNFFLKCDTLVLQLMNVFFKKIGISGEGGILVGEFKIPDYENKNEVPFTPERDFPFLRVVLSGMGTAAVSQLGFQLLTEVLINLQEVRVDISLTEWAILLKLSLLIGGISAYKKGRSLFKERLKWK